MEDYHCQNEARITAIETRLKNKRYELNDFEEKLTDQNKNLNKLTTEVTKLATILQETQNVRAEQSLKIDNLEVQMSQVNATMNTLKWVFTIFIALFGGLLVFLVSELIKLIH